jgi:hypothetical protein
MKEKGIPVNVIAWMFGQIVAEKDLEKRKKLAEEIGKMFDKE